jgi:RNA polymerase sigma-70 factor (ECF subfamily)
MAGASQLALITRLTQVEYASDADLLAGCRRHETAAFEHCYQAHGGRLKSIAWHLLGNRQDAEDAVQETFLKLYRGIDGFQGQSSLGTWLCRILINACHDLTRKRRRETDRELDREMDQEAPRAAQGAAGPKNQLPLRIALEDALRRIHPRHRMVFLLFEVEGLRHAEIASVMEVPEGTSKAWLFEAKKELRRMLTETRR